MRSRSRAEFARRPDMSDDTPWRSPPPFPPDCRTFSDPAACRIVGHSRIWTFESRSRLSARCRRPSRRRILPVALRHQAHQMYAQLEDAHHACRLLVEQGVGEMVEEVALELEVDNEVSMSLDACWGKRPHVCQVLQRSSFSSAHSRLPRAIQRDPAREAFLEWAKPDLEFSDDSCGSSRWMRAGASGHK